MTGAVNLIASTPAYSAIAIVVAGLLIAAVAALDFKLAFAEAGSGDDGDHWGGNGDDLLLPPSGPTALIMKPSPDDYKLAC